MPQIDKISIEDAVRVGVALHKEGHVEEAELVYRDILDVAPDQPDALHFLGVLLHQLGRSTEGVDLVGRALHLAAGNAGMQLNYGNINRELGRFETAERAYREASRIDPRAADPHCNLGSLLRALKRNEEARIALEKAIELNPRHGEAHHNLGNLFRDERDSDGAIKHYRLAAEFYSSVKSQAKASANLATALQRAGRRDDAERVLREWLIKDQENPTAIHMLAALTGQNVPDRASNGYVRELFDSFANSFDEALELLSYKAPRVVGERLERYLGTENTALTVLDAGCGTGLAGEHLQVFANRLIGVDLSSVMIEKARSRGGYDELVVAEVTEFLRRKPQIYDLIVSVDTLCYFGSLEKVLKAAYKALRPDGALCFTVEKSQLDRAGTGYELREHGRYAHLRSYVETLIRELQFERVEVEETMLRLEAGQGVAGYVVCARRGAG